MEADFLLKNINEIATPLQNSDFTPAQFICLENGALAAANGKIVWIGKSSDVNSKVTLSKRAQVIDAVGKVVTPGFVDCHTHPVFFGTREHEFEMRVGGKSYEEIAAAGGGILSSVRALRKASQEELIQVIFPRLDRFLAFGTTTIEAKSGYGLTVEDEIKSLKVISEANKRHPVELVPTFLGAHETPPEYRRNKSLYIDVLINEMMPLVKEENLAVFCDIFCETSVFNLRETRTVLTGAKDFGFDLKIHADQLTRNGGTALAAEMGVTSADHLEHSEEDDWKKLVEEKVVPVMLPGAVFFLGKSKYAPAKEMLEMGLPIALATDFNPGTCMSESMPFMMTLACLKLKLTPAQAITAATYHSALALNKGNLLGTLEVGKEADLIIWDVPNYRHIPYHFGVNLIKTVVKSGKVVKEN